jgi:hypothetical protein
MLDNRRSSNSKTMTMIKEQLLATFETAPETILTQILAYLESQKNDVASLGDHLIM